jgi:hypothetical protein
MIPHRNIAEWRAQDLVDRDGDAIGKLELVSLEEDSAATLVRTMAPFRPWLCLAATALVPIEEAIGSGGKAVVFRDPVRSAQRTRRWRRARSSTGAAMARLPTSARPKCSSRPSHLDQQTAPVNKTNAVHTTGAGTTNS